MIEGQWTGTLTYRDFKSGKEVTMPCNLALTTTKNDKALVMAYSYPDNASWNSKDNVAISADGRYVNGEKIKSRTTMADGTTEIIIESRGQDGSTPATILLIIRFSPSSFTFGTQVQYMTTGEKFMRNQYAWKR